MNAVSTMRMALERRPAVRDSMTVTCPRPETLGCKGFECSFDRDVCDTECLNVGVPCVVCANVDKCDLATKDHFLYIDRVEKTKTALLEVHDSIQEEVLQILKYWKSFKVRQKWAAKEKLKDLNGQLKGLRYSLHKLGVPYHPTYRTNLKVEEVMVEYWRRRSEEEGYEEIENE
jgi:hypothetical protein